MLGACATETEALTEISPTQPEEPSIVETVTSEPVRLRTCFVSLWHSLNEFEVESLNGVAETFQEINPEFEFEFVFTPEYDLKSKYEIAAASGEGPSILFGAAEWGPPLYDLQLIRDVSEFTSDDLKGSINPAALGAVQYSEAVIGLPLSTFGVLMFRNANLIPETPETFNDLVIKAQEATEGDTVGVVLDYGLYYSGGHLHGIGGALMDDQGNPAFNNEQGVEWVELLERFSEAGPVESNDDNDINLFSENKAGIIIDSLGNAAQLQESIGAVNLIVDPWPPPLSGYVQTENIYLNANLEGDELDCAWKFMEFMLSPEAQEIFSDSSMANKIPSILGLELNDPLKNQVMEAFSGGTAFPVVPEMAVYWDPVNNALLSVIESGADPADTLQDAADVIKFNIDEMHGE